MGRNLSVVLSLNDVKNNIIIVYHIHILNNSMYKGLCIVNNVFFIENTPYILFTFKLKFFKELSIPCCRYPILSGLTKKNEKKK